MTTSEKVAYLKGLAEGFGIDPASHEGKLLSVITDILEDLALDVDELGGSIAELEEGLDAVSEDLEDVEQALFGGEDDLDDEEDEEDGEQPVFYEAECPSCGETVTFDEGVLARGAIECPTCGESLEFDLDFREEDPEET